jgi:hypothetical protein
MKKLLLLLPCLAAAFTSCSDESPVDNPNEQAILQVNTYVGSSRAMISDTSLPGGSSLGVTLVENKDDATNYDGLRLDISISNTRLTVINPIRLRLLRTSLSTFQQQTVRQ